MIISMPLDSWVAMQFWVNRHTQQQALTQMLAINQTSKGNRLNGYFNTMLTTPIMPLGESAIFREKVVKIKDR